jgi:hypothetical protein
MAAAGGRLPVIVVPLPQPARERDPPLADRRNTPEAC